MGCAPGVFRIKGEPLHVLSEAAVARRGVGAGDAGVRAGRRVALRGGRDIVERQRGGDAAAVCSGLANVAVGVGWILDKLLGGRGEGAAEDGLMNEVNAEL